MRKERREIEFRPAETAENPAAENAVETVSEEEALYESEAYGNPQPDEGIKTTVTKPVGIGGPVPIVAPKHNTIQLQPIVVPLAVVPYMSQESEILRTDGDGRDAVQPEYGRAVEFDSVRQETAAREKKRTGIQKRMFSLVTLVLSCLLTAAFLLAYFKPDIHAEFSLAQADIIGAVKAWVGGARPADLSLALVNCVAAAGTLVLLIASLVGLIFGKYPRKTLIFGALLVTAAYAAELVYQAAKGIFDAPADACVFVMLCLGGLALVLSAVFAAVQVRREDKAEEEQMRMSSEI